MKDWIYVSFLKMNMKHAKIFHSFEGFGSFCENDVNDYNSPKCWSASCFTTIVFAPLSLLLDLWLLVLLGAGKLLEFRVCTFFNFFLFD